MIDEEKARPQYLIEQERVEIRRKSREYLEKLFLLSVKPEHHFTNEYYHWDRSTVDKNFNLVKNCIGQFVVFFQQFVEYGVKYNNNLIDHFVDWCAKNMEMISYIKNVLSKDTLDLFEEIFEYINYIKRFITEGVA